MGVYYAMDKLTKIGIQDSHNRNESKKSINLYSGLRMKWLDH